MKISACMIVKNESKNIEKCINSFKDIVNEIIVVDTGSTDNTVELANNLGAKVLFMEWQNDFATPKNYAIENATGDWIIFLDADEYFEEGSSKKIISALNILNNQSAYNSMGCKMYHLDSENGAVKGQNVVVRAFKGKSNIRYKNSIHENLLDGNNNLNSLYFSDIVVYHTGYENSKIASKYRRNIELLESVISKGEADTMTYYYLCSSYNGINDFEKSIFYADKTFEEEKRSGFRVSDIYRYKVYTSKIQSMGMLGGRYSNNQIGEEVSLATSEYPDHPEVLWIKAQYLTRIKKFRDSLDCYLSAVESNKKDTYGMCNYFESYIDQVYSNIGTIYVYLNLEESAFNYFLLSLEKNKFNKDAALRFLRLARSNKDEHTISILNKLYNTNEFTEIKFLIECLCETRLPVPLIYYTKKWNNTFEQEDISVLLSMFAMGKYDDVIELGLINAKNSSIRAGLDIAAASILVSGLFDKYSNELVLIDQDAFCLLSMMNSAKCGVLNERQIELIKSLLKLVIPFCSEKLTTGVLDFILNHVNDNIVYILFDQLLYYNKYDLALDYYIKLVNKTFNREIAGMSSFISGFCAYRTKNFMMSVNMLGKAIEYGNSNDEISELLSIIKDQCNDADILENVATLIEEFTNSRTVRLNIGCGRDIKNGWVNLDFIKLPGVDVTADLDDCANTSLPFEDNTIDEILASHVIEHIKNPLPLMQELYRIAKPGAGALFKCPYGSSDDAFEDPTHVKQYYLNSFGYFSQPFYWRADYGYRGDWHVKKITLVVDRRNYSNKKQKEIMEDILTYRNVVRELIVELIAIKPLREQREELNIEPEIFIQYT